MKLNAVLFLVLNCSFLFAQAEKKVDHQSLLWTRYYNLLTLSDKWLVLTEFDNRIFLNPVKQNLYKFRIQGRYKINDNLDVGAGFAHFSVATQDPEINFDFNVPENRGQQDIIWKQDIGKITIAQRFEVEERFFHNHNEDGLLPGTTYFWRFRYRIQCDHTFWKNKNHFLKAILFDEIMINAGKNVVNNTFDQNRIYAALHYGINKNFAVELGYLSSFQQRASGVDYFDRDIIRLTFFHKMNIHKMK